MSLRRLGNDHILKCGDNKKVEGSTGNDLLSQAVTGQVPSALAGLTFGFEMDPGVAPPLESPKELPLIYLSGIIAYTF